MKTGALAAREVQQFLAGLDRPAETQRECLLERVVGPNLDCEYGRRFGFADVRSARDYQARVPIVRYDGIRGDVERIARGEQGVLTSEPVRRFFLTSGSTARPKYIPVTGALVRDKWRAFSIYWNGVFEDHPEARSGTMVTNFADFGGPTASIGGVPCSSESSFWAAWTAQLRLGRAAALPRELSRIDDYDSRYYTIARILLEKDVSLIMTMNPSTIVLLLEKIAEFAEDLVRDVAEGGVAGWVRLPGPLRARIEAEHTGSPDRAAELRSQLGGGGDRGVVAARLWPGLRLVACWRSGMLAPYLRLLEPLVGSVPQRDYISMASEAILAIPLEDRQSGGVLPVNIHFYEFIPEEQADLDAPDVLLADEVEAGRNYAVVLSTSAGLYRYDIGDVVRVKGFVKRTPVIEFLHRLGATCSLTGEKLTEEQVVQAVWASSQRSGLQCTSFAAFPSTDGFPHYVVLVEFATAPRREALLALRADVDRELAACNVEYASKRASLRLGAPALWVVRAGGFAAWRRQRVAEGANDDQVKPTHLSRDPVLHRRFDIVERISAD